MLFEDKVKVQKLLYQFFYLSFAYYQNQPFHEKNYILYIFILMHNSCLFAKAYQSKYCLIAKYWLLIHSLLEADPYY
jgi:hypothetical protein